MTPKEEGERRDYSSVKKDNPNITLYQFQNIE
jgi:hypothetical protein